MNFHIYREITNDTVRPIYQLIGSTRFREDAHAMLERWHSGYIIDSSGVLLVEKNLTRGSW